MRTDKVGGHVIAPDGNCFAASAFSEGPVILTKNGYGDMVVMSYEEYQSIQYEMGVMRELRAAELEAETTTERHAHEDVMAGIRDRLRAVRDV